MKPFDLGTLIYIIAAISLLFGFLMLIFNRINPDIKGPIFWSLGSFSIVVGSLLFTMDDLINGYFAFVISGTFAVAGMGLYWAGIRAFKELQVKYSIIGGIILFQFVFCTLFYAVFSMPNARMATYSSAGIMVGLLSVLELKKGITKPYRLAFNICLIVFVISILTSVLRITVILTTLPGDAHNPSFANLLVYFFVNITQAMLIFSFMMMVSVKVSERLKVKVDAQRKFYSIISHDLSGPVGMINVMLNMANHDHELPESQKSIIYNEVENLSGSTYHLLQNLLFWSRNQLENLKPNIHKFDLNKVILDNIEFMQQIAKTKGISIGYESGHQLHCLGDVRMIDTVVRNLISNSIKYSHSGGEITITGENSGMYVLVKISDNGVGMSDEIQRNLFLFNEISSVAGTNGEKGSGLGLLLCKEFVEGNDGTLSIRSKVNSGTEVIVKLPGA